MWRSLFNPSRSGWNSPVLHARLFSLTTNSAINIRTIEKVLIANRGEIACRVMKTARRLGLKTVAVYSDADRYSRHVQLADEGYLIGPPPAAQSYLRQDLILDVARRSGSQAIHPGYGFLSENAQFADACERENVIFIGPPSSAISAMGSKSASKEIMEHAQVPVVPGYHGKAQDIGTFKREAKRIGYPIMVKAVMGGGGKGMRIVETESELEAAIESSRHEARSSFGDDAVLIEKYLRRPRHIEVQVFADRHGNCVYLFERDCSLQRRHQKVIEEAPAPGMTPEQRAKIGQAAVNAAKAVGYVGAGTVEFIVDEDGTFYFMEMNTRLQVEHPVTEMITGQDLVEWQLKVASGFTLPLAQEELQINGHSFEARVYAEDPAGGFLPCTGRLVHLKAPEENSQVRVETGVRTGDQVAVFYDPMIAKLVVWDKDRASALRRLRQNLHQYQVVGVKTNISFLTSVTEHPAFIAGDVETNFIQRYHSDLLPAVTPAMSQTSIALAALSELLRERQARLKDTSNPWNTLEAKRLNHPSTRTITLVDSNEAKILVDVEYGATPQNYTLTIHRGKESSSAAERIQVSGSLNGNELEAMVGNHSFVCSSVRIGEEVHIFNEGAHDTLTVFTPKFTTNVLDKGSLLAPMPGKIVKVFAEVGASVKKGDPLIVMEAMKMEHTIRALHDGTVTSVHYEVGQLVDLKAVLVTVKE